MLAMSYNCLSAGLGGGHRGRSELPVFEQPRTVEPKLRKSAASVLLGANSGAAHGYAGHFSASHVTRALVFTCFSSV